MHGARWLLRRANSATDSFARTAQLQRPSALPHNRNNQALQIMGLLTIIRKNREKEKEMRLLFL